MFVQDYCVVDFNFQLENDRCFEKEAEFIKIFANENQKILLPCLEINLLNFTEEMQEFILGRTVIKSSDWILTSPEDFLDELENKTVYWYELKNQTEFVKALEEDYFFYACCILDKELEAITKYTYLLEIEENYPYNGEEYRSLCIKEKNDGDFKKFILPKINERFPDFLNCKIKDN